MTTRVVVNSDPSFRRRVKSIIEPYRLSFEKPPYRDEQLVAIALIQSSTPIRFDHIYDYIISHFPYYRKKLSKNICQSYAPYQPDVRTGIATQEEVKQFLARLQTVLLTIDMPLRTHTINEFPRYRMSKAAAEVLLKPSVLSVDSKQFDFFKLPAELREMIYEMVFAYPDSGLAVQGPQRSSNPMSGRFRVVQSSLKDIPESSYLGDSMMYESLKKGLPVTRGMSQILAPLLLSRQFFAEAMPKFYHLNMFHCERTQTLADFLSALSDKRRAELTHISFRYDGDCKSAVAVSKALVKLPQLRKLEIDFKEQGWQLKAQDRYALQRHQDVTKMLGFSTLRNIRGLREVYFHRSPIAERELKTSMMSPRKATRAGGGGKKRKAGEDPKGASAAKCKR